MGVASVPGAGVVRAKGEISRTCARTRQGRKGVEASSSPLLSPAPTTQAGWKWICRSLAPCWSFVVKLKERPRIDCKQFLRIISSPEPVSILAGEVWAQGSPRSQASPTKCMGQEDRKLVWTVAILDDWTACSLTGLPVYSAEGILVEWSSSCFPEQHIFCLQFNFIYSLEERSRKIGHCSWSKKVNAVKVYRKYDSAKTTNNKWMQILNFEQRFLPM